ncbi:MAG: hypothetical protein K1X64_08465 [Myxococcaceae bacterium]|nr:hypothetical protein [Myxococcaceae bacterium]
MTLKNDELDQLLAELTPNEDDRAELLEAHRLLEHDLSRLADPAPPVDLVQRVMARVAEAPALAPGRQDAYVAFVIVSVAALLGTLALASQGVAAGAWGVWLTKGLTTVSAMVLSTETALAALWQNAALPTAVAAMGTSLVLVWGLRRFSIPAAATGRAS